MLFAPFLLLMLSLSVNTIELFVLYSHNCVKDIITKEDFCPGLDDICIFTKT